MRKGISPVRPSKRLGQHFIFNEDILEKIAHKCELSPEDIVVEIGAGTGSLTQILSKYAGKVIAIELDRRLIPSLQERFENTNVEIVQADALKFDYAGISETYGRKIKITGNLPFSITSPLLFKLMQIHNCIELMVIMVQREVGERICSPPGSRKYGILSILCRLYWKIERLFIVEECSFYPQPSVKACVIRFLPNPHPALSEINAEKITALIKKVFAKRRKMLKNSIIDRPETPEGKALIRKISEAGIDPTLRPEDLSHEDFIRIYWIIYSNEGS